MTEERWLWVALLIFLAVVAYFMSGCGYVASFGEALYHTDGTYYGGGPLYSCGDGSNVWIVTERSQRPFICNDVSGTVFCR